MIVHPDWLADSTKEDIELYLDFWKELDPIERRVLVYSGVLYKRGPTIEKMFGAETKRKKSVEAQLGKIRGKLERKLRGREPNLGAHTGGRRKVIEERAKPEEVHLDRVRYCFAVNAGFYRLVLDISSGKNCEGGSYSQEEEKRQTRQAALLYLDIPRLDHSVKRWLNENRR